MSGSRCERLVDTFSLLGINASESTNGGCRLPFFGCPTVADSKPNPPLFHESSLRQQVPPSFIRLALKICAIRNILREIKARAAFSGASPGPGSHR